MYRGKVALAAALSVGIVAGARAQIESRPAGAEHTQQEAQAPLAAGEKSKSITADTAPVRYTEVRRLPREVTLAQLSNGLTVIVQENHVAPVATVRCYVKNTGSAYEGRYLGAGLSHVLEHVVARGSTTRRSEKEIERMIDSFGGNDNAFTTTDMTSFYINCPAKDVMPTIDLMADAMQHIKFEPAEFERELKVVRRELADDEVERGHAFSEMLSATLYMVSPARLPVIGYLDVLNKTTNQAIIDFYHQRYVPQNQVFVVVGDVESQKVLDQVAGQYAETRRSYETQVDLPDEPEQLSPREAVREMEGPTYDLALAWPTVPLAHKNLYALDLAAYVIGEGESSRLVQRLKYERPLVMSIHADSYTPHFVRGYFSVTAVAQPEHWQQAEQEMLREVYRLRDELVAPAELARAKKQKAAELVFGSQTVEQAADSLGRSYITTDDPLFEHHYVDEIQKVTAEEIREAARRYLLPQRLNRVIIAPPGGGPQLRRNLAAQPETQTRLVRLSNGLRVLLKRQPQQPMVNIQAFVVAGVLADTPATAGRSALLAEMLDKGTAQHSARQIAEWFDSVGGQFDTSAGRNTVYADATMLRDDFPQALTLLAECFTGPTFPDEQFQRMKQLMLGAIERRSEDPNRLIAEFYYDNLPPDSPYHIIEGGKADTVAKLTADELRAYHAKYFVPNNMLVTVFGDIEPDQALRLVEERFGRLKSDPQFKRPDFHRPNELRQPIVHHKPIAQETAMIMLGYPECSMFDKADFAALTVLQAIVAGYHAPGGWLYNELRGLGLVYSVYAVQLTGPAPGYFTVAAQTRPDKLQEVVGRIRDKLQRAAAGQITADEFQVARQMVLALHPQENTTIAAQARQAALDELYGLGYDYDKQFDQRIQAVTLPGVVRAAQKYLGGPSVLVTASPEKDKARQRGKNE